MLREPSNHGDSAGFRESLVVLRRPDVVGVTLDLGVERGVRAHHRLDLLQHGIGFRLQSRFVEVEEDPARDMAAFGQFGLQPIACAGFVTPP